MTIANFSSLLNNTLFNITKSVSVGPDEEGCYPNNLTPTLISVSFFTVAIAGMFAVCICGGITAHKKAIEKRMGQIVTDNSQPVINT